MYSAASAVNSTSDMRTNPGKAGFGEWNDSIAMERYLTEDVNEDPIYTSLNPTNNTVYMTASMFRNVTVPLMCGFGVIGNLIAMVTLLYKNLHHTSCHFYLAVRSLSDTLFLLTLLAVWFDSVEYHFFHSEGICQIVVFTSYVTSFMSVWCVVAITFENYIRLCHPSKVKKFCTLYVARRVTFGLTLFGVIMYQTSLWSTGIEEINGVRMCMTNEKYKQLYIVMSFLDIVCTFLIPLCVISFLIPCIVYSAIQSFRRRVRLRKTPTNPVVNMPFSSTPQAKVTRLLLSVSIIFLILHTPIHIIKVKMIVSIYIMESYPVKPIDAALKTVFETMYYLNFSANFLVFFLCGESFRQMFWQLFCNCVCKTASAVVYVRDFRHVEQQTDVTLLSHVSRHPSLVPAMSDNGSTLPLFIRPQSASTDSVESSI